MHCQTVAGRGGLAREPTTTITTTTTTPHRRRDYRTRPAALRARRPGLTTTTTQARLTARRGRRAPSPPARRRERESLTAQQQQQQQPSPSPACPPPPPTPTPVPRHKMSETESLLSLDFPPPLDLVWLSHEEVAGLRAPTSPLTPHDRQRLYAAQCRERNRAMMAAGARDRHLGEDVAVEALCVPSREDGFGIPVLRYAPAAAAAAGGRSPHDESLFGPEPEPEPESDVDDAGVVAVYYHGGGLVVGEADSEELTCRRLVAGAAGAGLDLVVYSVGYRLMPQNPASTCVADAFDAFTHLRRRSPAARVILVGSSSGGELTALVSQMAPPGSLAGVLLRCPVTVDPDHIPAPYRRMHTSASDAFVTTLLGKIKRDTPRDGLAWMPLEGPPNAFARLPRTWVQICTNDVLYSDGVCYARALKNAGVEVQIDVVKGWPHTFWLKAPHLHRALQADEEVVRALSWVLHGDSGS